MLHGFILLLRELTRPSVIHGAILTLAIPTCDTRLCRLSYRVRLALVWRHSLTIQLSACSSVLEELIISSDIHRYHAIYGTGWFISVITSADNWSLS
jgi:hypothetical protein